MPPAPDNKQDDSQQAESPQFVRGSKIAYDFATAILGCGALGWVVDHYFGTRPWGVVVMILVGFAIGVFGAWRSLTRSPDER